MQRKANPKELDILDTDVRIPNKIPTGQSRDICSKFTVPEYSICLELGVSQRQEREPTDQ